MSSTSSRKPNRLFMKHRLIHEAQVFFFNEACALLYTSSRSASDFLQSANDSSRATASRNKRLQSKRSTTTHKQQNKDKQKHKEQHRTHAPKKLKTEIMMCHYLSITTLKERLISSRPGTRKRTHPEASCRKVTC